VKPGKAAFNIIGVTTMTDDRNAARRAAAEELRENLRFMHALGVQAVVYHGEGGCDLSGCPDGDGEGMFIPITIGSRGNLSKAEAKRSAAMWRKAIGRYPKGCFMISLLGYNDDPREVWEFRDARRYVRWWARFADMDDPATADRWLGASSAIGRSGLPWPFATGGMGFLAACGVFGEAPRQAAVRGHQPTVAQ
jgi:hypothetical protein